MNEITDLEKTALEVLKSTGSDVLEAALVAKAALAVGRGRVNRHQARAAGGHFAAAPASPRAADLPGAVAPALAASEAESRMAAP